MNKAGSQYFVTPTSPSSSSLLFQNPAKILKTRRADEVLPLLEEAENALQHGCWVAGYITYEAAQGMDPKLVTHHAKQDLLWLGVYPEVLFDPKVASFNQPFRLQNVTADMNKSSYLERVQCIKDHIANGNTYQVNYCFGMEAAFEGDPWAFFGGLLRSQNPELGAYLHTGQHVICSVSPELFFKKEGSLLRCEPMKGTAYLDAPLNELEKNRAENIMIVDMIRNDLGKVAHSGSVKTTKLFSETRYATLKQMTSTVEASFSGKISHLLQSLFPCASITGAPKRETMRIIASLEPRPRGVYTGAIGFMSPSGDAHFSVGIRTSVINVKQGRLRYGVGSGIVWDSDPEQEYQECLLKADVLRRNPGPFHLLETILWEPEKGFTLMDKHLQRIKESAQFFRFEIDTEYLRKELLNKVSHLSKRSKIRLLLAPHGEVTLEVYDESLPKKEWGLFLDDRPVDSSDVFLQHKTTFRDRYNQALSRFPHADDVLLWNERNEITETCFGNIVFKREGCWYTPPLESGLLKGTMRTHLLQTGQIKEALLLKEECTLISSWEVINAVKGRISARIKNL